MNDQSEALIRELSEKLGTTAENLWGVLLTQAPITGLVNLLVMAAWAGLMVWAFRVIKKQTAEDNWDEDLSFVAWIAWVAMSTLAAIIAGCSLAETVAALINPEYWALMQILPN